MERGNVMELEKTAMKNMGVQYVKKLILAYVLTTVLLAFFAFLSIWYVLHGRLCHAVGCLFDSYYVCRVEDGKTGGKKAVCLGDVTGTGIFSTSSFCFIYWK